jgi:hypothetical protein
LLRYRKTVALRLLSAAWCALTVVATSGQREALGQATNLQQDEIWTPQSSGGQSPIDESAAPTDFAPHDDLFITPPSPPPGYWPAMDWLGLRHSYTHGRSVGWGGPLIGTSWLNRPFYVGADVGNMWMLRSVEDSVGRDVDLFSGIFIGADWDHYWGTELAFHWATPELTNGSAPDSPSIHSWFWWNYSLMYYPWGDAQVRPYWRWGIGNTRVDFPLDDGTRHGEWLFTFPIGVGIKWPIRPWLAARTELTDYIAFDGSDVLTQNNLTLTFGLECRFGAHPRSYWPWHPSRHIW